MYDGRADVPFLLTPCRGMHGAERSEGAGVSHDSGFRRGGQDFAHRQNPKSQRRKKSNRRFEQRMEQRFHEHEKEAVDQEENTTPDD